MIAQLLNRDFVREAALMLAADLRDASDVAELDRVSEGRSMRAVGHGYSELADITSQLAKAVERQDRASGLLPAASRRRRSA